METLSVIGISVWVIAKIFVLLALAIYIVFAFVVVKQTKLMIETIEIGFSLPIRIMGYLHLLFALGIFILALIIL